MSDEIQAISQGNYILHNIDAKKLYVQEPLFTANSGDAVYVGWRPDETVLWEGSATNAVTTEDPNNFEQLRVCVKNTATPEISTFTVDSSNTPFGMNAFGGFADGQQIFGLLRGVITTAGLSFGDSKTNKIPYSDGGSKTITVAAGGWVYTKVVGINRKENA